MARGSPRAACHPPSGDLDRVSDGAGSRAANSDPVREIGSRAVVNLGLGDQVAGGYLDRAMKTGVEG
jgi:hypothetical protein